MSKAPIKMTRHAVSYCNGIIQVGFRDNILGQLKVDTPPPVLLGNRRLIAIPNMVCIAEVVVGVN